MPSSINFALQILSYSGDTAQGIRLSDGTSVTVKMGAFEGSGIDRRRSIAALQQGSGEVKIGGIISVERWHQEAGDPSTYYAGYIHRLSATSESFEQRALVDVMAKPSAPYGGDATPARAYVDILNRGVTCTMGRAKEAILRAYTQNDYTLGNPFVLVRDAAQKQQCLQLPVCHKVKDGGVWVIPSESDVLRSLLADPYKKFSRLLDKLKNRTEEIEIVPGFRAQVSSALAQDPRYISLQAKLYSVESPVGSYAANYRSSMLSFNKHKSPGSKDYYVAYLCPTLRDSGSLNLAGRLPSGDTSPTRTN